jgi:hypothetical protein
MLNICVAKSTCLLCQLNIRGRRWNMDIPVSTYQMLLLYRWVCKARSRHVEFYLSISSDYMGTARCRCPTNSLSSGDCPTTTTASVMTSEPSASSGYYLGILLWCDFFDLLQMLGSKLSCNFQAVRTLLTFADFSHSCEVAISGHEVFLQVFLMITDWRSPA